MRWVKELMDKNYNDTLYSIIYLFIIKKKIHASLLAKQIKNILNWANYSLYFYYIYDKNF